MKTFIRFAAVAAVFALTTAWLPGTTQPAEARLGGIGGIGGPGGFGDFVAIDGCGTVQTVQLFLGGEPFGTCTIWVPDGFGFSVRVGSQFNDGDRVYIQGLALLAQTNVYPSCPALPLVSATFSDCE
jgi:hypothetical protein